MSEIIHFLLLPGFSAMGFISALEPLRVANRFRGPLYRWRVLSLDGGAVQASNGMSVNADGVLGEGEAARMLLIVAGFEPLACYGAQLHQVLRRLDHEGVLLGGIDTGAMVLAETGRPCIGRRWKPSRSATPGCRPPRSCSKSIDDASPAPAAPRPST